LLCIIVLSGTSQIANSQDLSLHHLDTLYDVKIKTNYFAEIKNDHLRDLISVITTTNEIMGLIYLQTDSLIFELSDTIRNLNSANIAFVDLDNSGQIDLVVEKIIDSTSTAVCLQNYSDIAGFGIINILETDSLIQTEIIDLNQDGLKDLFIMHFKDFEKQLSILYQTEKNIFELDTTVFNVDKILPLSVNKDGLKDVLLYNRELNLISALIKQNETHFNWDTVSLMIDYPISDWVVSDVNHDGNVDIIIASNQNFTSTIYSLKINKDTIKSVQFWTSNDEIDFITSADFDNDGLYDVLISSSNMNTLLTLDEQGVITNELPITGSDSLINI